MSVKLIEIYFDLDSQRVKEHALAGTFRDEREAQEEVIRLRHSKLPGSRRQSFATRIPQYRIERA